MSPGCFPAAIATVALDRDNEEEPVTKRAGSTGAAFAPVTWLVMATGTEANSRASEGAACTNTVRVASPTFPAGSCTR